MKWAIAQLKKFKKPYTFEYDFDLINSLPNPGDLLGCQSCIVSGVMHEYLTDNYEFDLHIKADLIMQCAISLEPVEYHLEFDTNVIYGYVDDESSNFYPIERETLDLDEAVLSEIVLNLPYRVIKPGYEDEFQSEETEEKINPSFAILKDLYGGEDK